MAKSKKRSVHEDPEDNALDAPPGTWLTRLMFRPRVLLLVALAVSSTVLIPIARSWLPDLRKRDEYALRAGDIHVNQPPAWVPQHLVLEVIEQSEMPPSLSILDEGLNAALAEAFASHPWVAKVVAVRKTPPARVEVELEYRRPVAMVEMQQGLYPIDAQGVLLPPADFSAADAEQFPRIRNVASPPQGPAGSPWGDGNIEAGSRLAAVLAPHWQAFGLKSIDVPADRSLATPPDSILLELRTHGGSRIVWGRAPGTDHPGELPAKQKIARLQEYLERFGSFDEPHGPYEIDIRHWQEITRRRIAALPRNAEKAN